MIWAYIAIALSILGYVQSMPAFSDPYFLQASNTTLQDRQVSQNKWKLQIEYSGKTFFDGWDFFNTGGEPKIRKIRARPEEVADE
jgi:hypothetical protein